MQMTLATLGEYTAQQVFDHVKNHLLTQGKRSVGPDGFCKYRGTEGLKCAAGCLISDEEYDPSWEGKTWRIIFDHEMPHLLLVRALQRIHDTEDPENWVASLKSFAKCLDLKYEDNN